MGLWNRIFGKNEKQSQKTKEQIPQQESNVMYGRVTALIINYEGPQSRDVEQQTINHLMPFLKPGSCRIMTYCNAEPPVLKQGEKMYDMISNVNTASAGVGMETMMAYIATKSQKGLTHPIEKVGYWVGEVRGTKIHAILCLD